MIVAIINQTAPVGVVPVTQFQVAADQATALAEFVAAFNPPLNPADYLAVDTGWPGNQAQQPPSGPLYQWAWDFNAPGFVEQLKSKQGPPQDAPGQTAQVFWDQPGVSPMAGTTSAFALMAPSPGLQGITGWWVWWGFPPAAGAQYRCRLYRYRNDPGFTYTQISDAFDITDGLTTNDLYDLSSYLRPGAADFDEAKNDVLALSVVITGGTTQLRALTQRVQFGGQQ